MTIVGLWCLCLHYDVAFVMTIVGWWCTHLHYDLAFLMTIVGWWCTRLHYDLASVLTRVWDGGAPKVCLLRTSHLRPAHRVRPTLC